MQEEEFLLTIVVLDGLGRVALEKPRESGCRKRGDVNGGQRER